MTRLHLIFRTVHHFEKSFNVRQICYFVVEVPWMQYVKPKGEMETTRSTTLFEWWTTDVAEAQKLLLSAKTLIRSCIGAGSLVQHPCWLAIRLKRK